MFLVLMVAGLAGLALMAMPALGKHGGALRSGHVGHLAKLAPVRAASTALTKAGSTAGAGAAVAHAPTALVHHAPMWTRFVPSPRLVFSMLALYGAFGNLLVDASIGPMWAALIAVLPAALVERFAITPLWNYLLGFQAAPSSPMDELLLADATAVTAFRNGKGIVSVVRDGRLVQFSAQLVPAQVNVAVRVGDRLRIEDLDAKRERLSVSFVGS